MSCCAGYLMGFLFCFLGYLLRCGWNLILWVVASLVPMYKLRFSDDAFLPLLCFLPGFVENFPFRHICSSSCSCPGAHAKLGRWVVLWPQGLGFVGEDG
jgi:hypothetical protein